ncbi:MAG: hypothetical protein K6T65_12855 [Peptococcaceae bacterium]|nr:hypothetical protein [Peptococcaceae bacterium]
MRTTFLTMLNAILTQITMQNKWGEWQQCLGLKSQTLRFLELCRLHVAVIKGENALGKRIVKFLCLFLGLFSLVVFPAGGAGLETTADMQEQFEIIMDKDALSFPKAAIGQISGEQKITALVKGNALYQLYIQATSFTTDDLKELPPSVLEFKEKSEPSWHPASHAQVPVLTKPAMANEKGDRKEIAFRLNIPPDAEEGLYNCRMTVIACVYMQDQTI